MFVYEVYSQSTGKFVISFLKFEDAEDFVYAYFTAFGDKFTFSERRIKELHSYERSFIDQIRKPNEPS